MDDLPTLLCNDTVGGNWLANGRMDTATGLTSNRFYTAREGAGVLPMSRP
jgi:hypothetical protein